MHWYNGGIADAITVTKQKGAIFVVYIEGNDDKSVQITNIINNETITNKLESENFVAIKIEANSVPHQQFSEIYKQAPSPSIFFIGKNGSPLEIITEVKDVESFSLQVDNILQRAGLSPTTNTPSSEALIKAEQQSNNVVCENGVCSIRPSTETASLSAEEKLNRAKELVEKQRIQKQKEEEEREREKEIERRKMGQNVQQMKRWQEDQELKQLKEEREREKRENQAARDRVLAQIAQDKAERAAKFSTSPPPTQQSKIEKTPQAGPSRQQSNVARLQFKLPDGGSKTQEFPSSDSLDQVVTYIKTTLNIAKFKLATTFPRREFTTNDYSQSLLDLQLVPNAVILVLPVNSAAVVASSTATSGLYAFFWSLIGPILGIFQYFKGFLTGTGGGNEGTSTSTSSGTNRGGGSVLHVRSKYDLENKLKMAGSTRLVVIDFFATWCGPCRMIAPKLEDLAREFPNVMFLKVDVDENRDIASDYRVSSMPTFAFVKNRRTLTNFSGADYYRLRDTILRYK